MDQMVMEFIGVDLIYVQTNRGRRFNLGGYGITHKKKREEAKLPKETIPTHNYGWSTSNACHPSRSSHRASPFYLLRLSWLRGWYPLQPRLPSGTEAALRFLVGVLATACALGGGRYV